jgi:hypothetical protein
LASAGRASKLSKAKTDFVQGRHQDAILQQLTSETRFKTGNLLGHSSVTPIFVAAAREAGPSRFNETFAEIPSGCSHYQLFSTNPSRLPSRTRVFSGEELRMQIRVLGAGHTKDSSLSRLRNRSPYQPVFSLAVPHRVADNNQKRPLKILETSALHSSSLPTHSLFLLSTF